MNEQLNANEPFTITLKVRDYECDIQGIVNNSVYQNYFEHARHEYLLNEGLSFAKLAAQEINLVVRRIELDYKSPLRSGDEFYVTVKAKRSGRIRGYFEQNLYRAEDNKLMTSAIVHWAAMNAKGRPCMPPEIEALLDKVEDQAGETHL